MLIVPVALHVLVTWVVEEGAVDAGLVVSILNGPIDSVPDHCPNESTARMLKYQRPSSSVVELDNPAGSVLVSGVAAVLLPHE